MVQFSSSAQSDVVSCIKTSTDFSGKVGVDVNDLFQTQAVRRYFLPYIFPAKVDCLQQEYANNDKSELLVTDL